MASLRSAFQNQHTMTNRCLGTCNRRSRVRRSILVHVGASLPATDTRRRLLEALLAEALAPVEERELEAAG